MDAVNTHWSDPHVGLAQPNPSAQPYPLPTPAPDQPDADRVMGALAAIDVWSKRNTAILSSWRQDTG